MAGGRVKEGRLNLQGALIRARHRTVIVAMGVAGMSIPKNVWKTRVSKRMKTRGSGSFETH